MKHWCMLCKFCEKRTIKHEVGKVVFYDNKYYCKFFPKAIEVKFDSCCGQYKD